MFENPYKILNISNDSNIEEVKKAYRKIALKSHPDNHSLDYGVRGGQYQTQYRKNSHCTFE